MDTITNTKRKLSSCFCDGNLNQSPRSDPLFEDIDTINYSVCLPLAHNDHH